MADKATWTKARLGLGLASAAIFVAASTQAADLDHYYRRRPPPPVVGYLPPPPSCKDVPLPQMNLYNEVTRAGIQSVCISRGVYMDSFWPYAPPYWRPNHRQGYGPED